MEAEDVVTQGSVSREAECPSCVVKALASTLLPHKVAIHDESLVLWLWYVCVSLLCVCVASE